MAACKETPKHYPLMDVELEAASKTKQVGTEYRLLFNTLELWVVSRLYIFNVTHKIWDDSSCPQKYLS